MGVCFGKGAIGALNDGLKYTELTFVVPIQAHTHLGIHFDIDTERRRLVVTKVAGGIWKEVSGDPEGKIKGFKVGDLIREVNGHFITPTTTNRKIADWLSDEQDSIKHWNDGAVFIVDRPPSEEEQMMMAFKAKEEEERRKAEEAANAKKGPNKGWLDKYKDVDLEKQLYHGDAHTPKKTPPPKKKNHHHHGHGHHHGGGKHGGDHSGPGHGHGQRHGQAHGHGHGHAKQNSKSQKSPEEAAAEAEAHRAHHDRRMSKVHVAYH